tara:strand:- start:597 stop:1316 length:720 start_codon:yes stop_codon:yes gene_type:complete
MADEENENENANEVAEVEGGDGADEENGGGKKKLIIIIAVVLLLVGGGAGAYFMGLLDGLLGVKNEGEMVCEVDDHGEEHCEPAMHCEVDDHGEEHCEPVEGHGDGHGGGDDGHGDDHGGDDGHGGGDDGHGDGHGGAGGKFVVVPTMLVNLNTEDGTPRYLRLSVQLELKSESDVAAVEEALPKVVDQFQTYLRELRVKDLRGSAGIYRLQMELLWRVNQAAAPVKVKDVLFQEILIQ